MRKDRGAGCSSVFCGQMGGGVFKKIVGEAISLPQINKKISDQRLFLCGGRLIASPTYKIAYILLNPNLKAWFGYCLARFARIYLQITATVAPMQKAV